MLLITTTNHRTDDNQRVASSTRIRDLQIVEEFQFLAEGERCTQLFKLSVLARVERAFFSLNDSCERHYFKTKKYILCSSIHHHVTILC